MILSWKGLFAITGGQTSWSLPCANAQLGPRSAPARARCCDGRAVDCRNESLPSALLHKWRFRSEYRFALARSANSASVRLCDVELRQLT